MCVCVGGGGWVGNLICINTKNDCLIASISFVVKVSHYVAVCVFEKERESVCVCVFEKEKVCVRVCLRERVCVCV